MADDDLRISASFDATPIIEGINKAADAIQEGAASAVGSFQQIATAADASTAQVTSAEAAFSTQLDQLLEPLIEVGGALEGVTVPATHALSAALNDALAPMGQAATETEALTPAELAFADALDQALNPVVALSATLTEAVPAELAFGEALDRTFESLLASTEPAIQLGEGLALVGEEAAGVAPPLIEASNASQALAEAVGLTGDELNATASSFTELQATAAGGEAALAASTAVFDETAASLEALQLQLTRVQEAYDAAVERSAALAATPSASFEERVTAAEAEVAALERLEEVQARVTAAQATAADASVEYASAVGTAVPTLEQLANAEGVFLNAQEEFFAASEEYDAVIADESASLGELMGHLQAVAVASEELKEAQSGLASITAAAASEVGASVTALSEQADRLGGLAAAVGTARAEIAGLAPAQAQLAASLSATSAPIAQVQNELAGATVAELAFREQLAAFLAPLSAVSTALQAGTEAQQRFSASLSEIPATLALATEGEASFGATLAEVGPQLNIVATGVEQAAAATESLAGAAATLIGPITEAAATLEDAGASGGTYAAAIGALVDPTEAAIAATTRLDALLGITATSASEAAAGLVGFQGAIASTAGAVSGMDAALADMAAAQEADATAKAEAIAAQQAYQDSLEASGLAAMQQAQATAEGAAVTAAASDSHAAFSVILEEGAASSAKLAAALEFLNNEEAVSEATSKQVKEAFGTIQQEAQRLNLELVKTASGFKLVALSGEEVVTKLSGMQSAMAYATARAFAYETGLGNLGFAFGTLARNSSTLATILNVAFPVIGAVLLIETISNLIDKYDQMISSVRKGQTEFDNFAFSQEHAAEQMELTNLKLEDQINKLNGVPSTNQLAEALMENTIQAQQLSHALEDATNKAQDLLKQGQVGFLTSLFSGQASTGGIKSAMDDQLNELRLALQQRELAEQQGNQAEIAASNQRVEAARASALKELQVQKQSTQDLLNEKKRQYEQGKEFVIVGGGGVAKAPGLDEAEARKLATKEVQSQIVQENALEIALRSQTLSESALAKAEADRVQAAKLAARDAAAGEKRTLTLPDIKAEEEAGRALASADREAAQQQYSATEAGLKLQVELQVQAGQDRVKAELATNAPLLDARKKLTQDLIAAENERFKAESEALEREKTLTEGTEFGDKRAADLETLNKRIELAADEHERTKQSIQDAGETAAIAITTQGEKQKTEIIQKEAQRRIQALRQEISLEVSDAKDQYGEAAAIIKAAEEEKLRAIQAGESSHTTTAQQARDARIAVYREETVQLQGEVQKQIDTLRSAQAQIQTTLSSGGATNTGQTKELNDQYLALEKTIEKLEAEMAKLNTEFGKNQTSAQIKYAQELEAQYEKVADAISSKFAGAFDAMIEHGTRFSVSMGKLALELEAKLVDSFFRALGRYAASKAAEVIISETTQQQQTAATAAGQAQQTAATNQGVIARIAKFLLEVTGHQTVQTAQTAQTTAGQAAQTGAVVAGQATQTGAVATGQAAQTGTVVTAQGAQTGAVVTGQAAQTAATNQGVLARIARFIFETIFHGGQQTVQTVQKTTASTAQTAINTSAQATQTATTTAAQAKDTATVVASQAAQTKAVVTAQAAQTAAIQAAGAAKQAATTIVDAEAISANAALAQSDVATSAAIVFLQAITNIPFPANVVAAPALADTTFSEGEPYAALAAAEKGALLDADQPIFAHAKEMILPADLSTGIQEMIRGPNRGNRLEAQSISVPDLAPRAGLPAEATAPSGTNLGGTGVNFHYHEGSHSFLDKSGLDEVMSRNRDVMQKHIQGMLRRGGVDPRRFR